VSKESEVKAMIDSAVDKFGRLDVLVRGLSGPGEMTADGSSTTPVSCTLRMPREFESDHDADSSDDDAVNTEEKIWDLTQSINVKGVWYGCKHGVLAMRNVGTHLVGVSSHCG